MIAGTNEPVASYINVHENVSKLSEENIPNWPQMFFFCLENRRLTQATFFANNNETGNRPSATIIKKVHFRSEVGNRVT
jgi:hypothetical protein